MNVATPEAPSRPMATLDLTEYYPVNEAFRRYRHNGTRRRKLEALVRAGFKCVACGCPRDLTIHRLTRTYGKRDLRTVLCVPCHERVNEEGCR